MTTIPDSSTSDNDVHQFTETERNAMRGYLQRCEVRLSTLHRIAQAFFGGAGLLVLIPVFFKDAVDTIISALLSQTGNHFPVLGSTGIILTGLLYIAIAVPLLLSLAIPLYGVYLLLKDIIHFYFTIYTPGFSENLLNPTFALTGVMFSVDESPSVKHEVMRYQYKATQMGFMIPFSQERQERYFDSIIERTHGDIIPESRHLDKLKQQGVLPDDYNPDTVNRFNSALGIARGLDRTLAQEVAVTEMSLVRHVLYLRRLVLRYIKTLLMFIWTTAVSFVMLPFLKDARFNNLIVLAIGYLVWSLAVMRIMDMPIRWIYRHRYGDKTPHHVDSQLRLMQETLAKYCYASIVCGVIGTTLAVLSLAAR
jgi:hypothetical protein